MSNVVNGEAHCEFPKYISEQDPEDYECSEPAVYFDPNIHTLLCEKHAEAKPGLPKLQ